MLRCKILWYDFYMYNLNRIRDTGISPDSRGYELEQAYAELLGGKMTGGDGDGGKDIIGIPGIPKLQIKNTLPEAIRFFTESINRRYFIPMAIGEPGTPEEVRENIIKRGGWVGPNIPNREKVYKGIEEVRRICATEKKDPGTWFGNRG